VGGTWVWQESAVPAENADCGRDLAWDAAPLMIITQSGPNLHITLGDVERTQMSGDIRELTITAAELTTEDDAPGLQLEATVDRQVEPDVMSGRLVIEGCPEVVPFTAERQPTASPSGGNH
jgi:hypothetical protein